MRAACCCGRVGEMVVRDDFQANGVGALLGGWLLHLARAAGVTTVRADLLAENRDAPRLLARPGLRCTATIEDGATRVLARVPEEPGDGGAGASGVARTGDAQASSRAPPTGQVRGQRRPGVAVGGAPQWPFAAGTRG